MSFKSILDWLAALLNKLFGPKPTFAMIGDSFIQNMAATQPILPPPFNKALNLGVGGQTTTQIRQRISSIPANIPVLLEGGGNNLVLDPTNNVAVADYTVMLNTIPSNQRVILLGMCRFDETRLDPALNIQIDALNARVNAVAAGHSNVTVAFDAQTVSMVGLTIDGAHPSPAGYSVVCNQLLKYV